MKRIVHCAVMLTASPGIVGQMVMEYRAAKFLKYDWEVYAFAPMIASISKSITPEIMSSTHQAKTSKLRAWFSMRIRFLIWVYQNRSNYDVFVFRYSVHDPLFLFAVILTRRKCCVLFHSLSVPELAGLRGPLSKIRTIFEMIHLRLVCGLASETAGVTNEIDQYHRRVAGKSSNSKPLVYPNGVEFRPNTQVDKRGGAVEFIFIASNFPSWHGLDMILDSFDETSEPFVLHLVGEIPSSFSHRNFNDSRLRVHGRLSQDEISDLCQSIDVGLSSFALFRKNMHEACTLKVREYLSSGLPVYSGHKDVFPDAFIFYHVGPAAISQAIEFAVKMRNFPRADVVSAAQPFIDKSSILEQFRNNLVSRFS